MFEAVVFDAYGTLFDVQAVAAACENAYPGNGEIISRIWRQKQLEYTWLRPLMNRYVGFDQVNRNGLRYALTRLGLHFTDERVHQLADTYLTLPTHPEAPSALDKLSAQKRFILSNGTKAMLTEMVSHAGLEPMFDDILSADEVRTYKPDPAVYTLAVAAAHTDKDSILFVSSNAWDVAGAKSFGFQVAWVNRQGTVPEQLDVLPDYEVSNLSQLVSKVME